MAIAKAKEHRDREKLEKLLKKGPSACGAFFHEHVPEKSRWRIEIRKCTTIPPEGLPVVSEWSGAKSLVRIDRERIIADKRTNERAHHLTKIFPLGKARQNQINLTDDGHSQRRYDQGGR